MPRKRAVPVPVLRSLARVSRLLGSQETSDARGPKIIAMLLERSNSMEVEAAAESDRSVSRQILAAIGERCHWPLLNTFDTKMHCDA